MAQAIKIFHADIPQGLDVRQVTLEQAHGFFAGGPAVVIFTGVNFRRTVVSATTMTVFSGSGRLRYSSERQSSSINRSASPQAKRTGP